MSRLPSHTHAEAYFCLVVRGGYEETCGDQTRDCGPMTLVVHPAGETHADRFGRAGATVFSTSIGAELCRRIEGHTRVFGAGAVVTGGSATHLATRLYREFSRPDDLSPLSMEATVLAIVAELGRSRRRDAQRPRAAWLARAKECLDDSFPGRITHSELARVAGVHPVHLAAVFRAEIGCTIGHYVRRRRVDLVRDQLVRTRAPIAEIAVAAGYSDQAHLTREFKKATGYTPARYRRLASRRTQRET